MFCCRKGSININDLQKRLFNIRLNDPVFT